MLDTYHSNFIKAARLLMANNNLETIKDISDYTGIAYQSLYKVMDGKNKPTTGQGITLCIKAGINANWLFLNKLPIYYEEEITMNKIAKKLTNLEKKL